jgi:hypothetical protein
MMLVDSVYATEIGGTFNETVYIKIFAQQSFGLKHDSGGGLGLSCHGYDR